MVGASPALPIIPCTTTAVETRPFCTSPLRRMSYVVLSSSDGGARPALPRCCGLGGSRAASAATP